MPCGFEDMVLVVLLFRISIGTVLLVRVMLLCLKVMLLPSIVMMPHKNEYVLFKKVRKRIAM